MELGIRLVADLRPDSTPEDHKILPQYKAVTRLYQRNSVQLKEEDGPWSKQCLNFVFRP